MSSHRCRVEFYQDHSMEWRWRFIAKNGRILADSGEGYKRRGACERAFNLVRFEDADIEYTNA